MHRTLLPAICFTALLAHPLAATAQSPRTLAARLEFRHTLRDMMDAESDTFVGRISLRIDPSGAATLELSGSAEHSRTTIPVPGNSPSTTPPRSPTRDTITTRWTGTARIIARTIEVRFVTSDAFRPPLAVDVSWRCEPVTVSIGTASVNVYRCQSPQRMTQPTGAAHHLPAYLQVPIYLADPSVQLSVQIGARSGADHRASSEYERFDHAR